MNVQSSFASMCTLPLDVLFNYGIFYISVDIVVMITYAHAEVRGPLGRTVSK
jgi:hypothetical protein